MALVGVAAVLWSAACSTEPVVVPTSSGPPGSPGPRGTIATAPGPRNEPPLPTATQDRLRDALDQTMRRFEVPGTVMAVSVPGVGSWQAAAGTIDLDADQAPSPTMAWPIRGITGSFTVTLLLQLADEGKLSLDDPVGRYVAGVPNGDTITLRHLAGMTSGLPEYFTQRFVDDLTADPGRAFTIDELNGYAFEASSSGAPGTGHVYTGTNLNLLGAVIEKVAGAPFAEVLRRQILDPLGLRGTAYLTDAAGWPDPHPTGYQYGAEGLERQRPTFAMLGPAGAMVSTVDDQRTWVEALARGTLLSESSHRARLQMAPLEEGPEYDSYGLGLGEIARWLGHTGEGVGFTALAMHDVATGTTVVIFMNASGVPTSAHPPTELFHHVVAVLADPVA